VVWPLRISALREARLQAEPGQCGPFRNTTRNDSLGDEKIMWNGRIHAAMAAAALSVSVAGPASAEYRNGAEYCDNGYARVYSYGWPAATYDAAGYGLSSAHGYGGSYRAASYNGLENGQSPSAAATAPAPERMRPIVRRRGPKRLE
jgi:hypothetical protein